MIRRTASLVSLSAVLALLALLPATAGAAEPAPAWKLTLTSVPTNFAPGASKDLEYTLFASNFGAAPTSGEITLTDTLPTGLTPIDAGGSGGLSCGVVAQTVTCTATEPLPPSRTLLVTISLEVGPLAEGSTVTNTATISGGGAAATQASTTTTISSNPAPFNFLAGEAGLFAPLTDVDGTPVTQAGGHPYQLMVGVGFPGERPSHFESLTGTEHPREVSIDLPPGVLGNPSALRTRCTEAQLNSQQFPGKGGCPESSQVGTIDVMAPLAGISFFYDSALYSMVPPPGAPAAFAFDAFGAGIFVHVIPSVRSDSDYGISARAGDILALDYHPLLGAQTGLWGDPSHPGHDNRRKTCLVPGPGDPPCPVEEPNTEAFLTMPGHCPGKPTVTKAHATSWEQPSVDQTAIYESSDLAGNPVSVEGCNALQFEPTISSQPTTNLADSPSGLEFELHQPQNTDLEGLSTAILKDATVTLPKGMAVNPSQADGLAVCTKEQIDLTTAVGETPAHFSKHPSECPDASKLGTVEVTSPLLAQYDEKQEVQRDPEGKPIPEPLHGSLYLAEPYQNPFESLIAIYLTVEDEKTGIFAKLAGEVIPDPVTGQLTTRFEENPQLPLEDVKLSLFGGARAPLITPPVCATHTTTSDLTPWSSPEGEDANPSDSFQTSVAPGGVACPSAEVGAPNAPSFSAGTIAPQAGSYSPFVLKLSRSDGSQRLAGIEATLPPGLSGKLAGVATCSEAQIATARARSNPLEGILEKKSPSCPASSELGTVDVAAGAGISPLHVEGRAYLAGPYKGAPLSIAVITPAVAGPFDLGVVVVRAALRVDPKTAQIHAVSDPLPTILEGVPLDVRQISMHMGRPQFTLNPTSCDPMQIAGIVTSALGQNASLFSPFQVGGCSQLPFKPKLSLRLKGGTKRADHPKLVATLRAKPGEANIAKAQVKLPRSAFLDQAHIRTICTRVQFAADSCPKGSIYGKATATTPILDYPISGNVYLRSSDNELPDLVVDLRGPAHQPIRIELAGRTDAVKGALRNSFDLLPDAPVSTFRLELFGGKRGLVVNSQNLCARKRRATVKLDGQNGMVFDSRPLVRSDCKGKKRKAQGNRRRAR